VLHSIPDETWNVCSKTHWSKSYPSKQRHDLIDDAGRGGV
jgi:hypothetical protein